MERMRIKNLVSVFEVRDLEASLAWYRKWLGEPDTFPTEGVAEYQIGEHAWLQLSCDGQEVTRPGSVVLGVDDVHAAKSLLESRGIETGEVADYEVVLVLDVQDVDGNRIAFAQEL